MTRTIRTTFALTLAALLTAPAALAGTDFLDFDALADLPQAGFEHYSNGTTTAADGILTIDAHSFEEWSLVQGDATSPWWRDVHPARGWRVEARLQIDPETGPPCQPGAFFWIHDGVHLLHVHVGTDWIGLTYPEQAKAAVTLDDAFHVVRVSMRDQHVMIHVDDQLALEHELTGNGGGTPTLMFGAPNVCQGLARSYWDWFSYATWAEPGGDDGDEDDDGVANHEDACPWTPDPDQADADADKLGDACDPCPLDRWNDSDGDGSCDSDDPCPSDPEDLDVDENGICDMDELDDCWCGPGGWDAPSQPSCGCDPWNDYGYPNDPAPQDDPPGDGPSDPVEPSDAPPPGADANTKGTMATPDAAADGCSAGGPGAPLPLALTLALLLGMVAARRRRQRAAA